MTNNCNKDRAKKRTKNTQNSSGSQQNSTTKKGRKRVRLTVTVVDKIIEGVTIAIIGEFVISSGQFLEALKSNGIEIPTVLGVLRENHGSTSDESVDQRFLRHL